MTTKFDLIVIGTGSGNSIIGPEFDSWKVALVEDGVFGGTCLNRGCIPTKMLVYVADLAESIRHGSELGLDATIDAVRWLDIRDRVFGSRIDPIAASGEDYRTNRCPNVTVFRSRGVFVGPKQVQVGDAVIEAEHIVVATGARPSVPAIPGLDAVRFYTSDDIMRIDAVPPRLAVLGGGFIASELAHVFAGFGSVVTMIHRGDVLLRQEDQQVAERFTEIVADRFDLRLRTQVTSCAQNGELIELTLTDGSVLEVDALLVATGRIPNSDLLDATAGGLEQHADGRIKVDSAQRTNIPGVWALGDISSAHMLKHVANHEARVVKHNLLNPGQLRESDHRFVPHAVFTRPQIAAVGMTEREARANGVDVIVSVRKFGDTAYGWAMEDTTGFCKLVADRTTRKLVGAHLIGPHSASLVQQLIQGMSLGQTIDEMAHGQYYIHPALPEVIENALLGF